jgi:aldehyde dehydrogenase (NAD+)
MLRGIKVKKFESLLNAKTKLKSISYRKEILKKLKQIIIKNEPEIFLALKKDLGRPDFESYVAEIALIKQELDLALSFIDQWTKKELVKTPLVFQPGISYVEPCPKGVVLIIAPWNYPFQLSLVPLISAIAAGNTIMLKPSELAVFSAALLEKMLKDLSPVVEIICGEADVAENLLDLPFDHIFYTGNSQVGSLVMKKAALYLTPVTLELGGKSPCIVMDNDELFVKRIIWGKLLNAGQTCIAPDYILIKKDLKNKFIETAKKYLKNYSINSPDYGRIINNRHFDRLVAYLKDGDVVYGGNHNREQKYIEPTILSNIKPKSPVLNQEIFGPILPVIDVENITEAINFIKERPYPLALYIFSHNQKIIDQVLANTLSGGVSINDCLSQAAIMGLPFGGIGPSGMGSYRGLYGFKTFSHFRAVHKRANILDNPIKYPPYSLNKLKLARIFV